MDWQESKKLLLIFLDQVFIMFRKHVSQKQRNGRQFWKESFLIQFFALSFISYIMFSASNSSNDSSETYSLAPLPPLSTTKPWGIFNEDSNGNDGSTSLSKRLYYSPNTHDGVNNLMASLVAKYPDIQSVGMANQDDVNDDYIKNIFDTWAYIQFSLTEEQESSGLLIPSQTSAATVSYNILMKQYGTLPDDTYTDNVYNKEQADADLYWSSGYLTLQNFIATYLTQRYDNLVSTNYTVDTFFQRFPSSPIYDDEVKTDIKAMRNLIWKWLGGTILGICLFVPMLSILSEIVRERQYLMKDLLEISGLMNSAYWFSYLMVIVCIGQFTIWACLGILAMYGVFDSSRVSPYAALMTCYVLAVAGFGMAFGFVIPKSEYYGLPVLMTTSALTVCGAYLGIAGNVNVSARLFLCYLCPPMGLTMGVLNIESYLYHHDQMDFTFVNESKNYPCLNDICGVLVASGITFYLFVSNMPFTWLFEKENTARAVYEAVRSDDVGGQNKYPCDNEEEEFPHLSDKRNSLLDVRQLSQIYPDGTNALKDMSFTVKEGEVLSFLGANGAGKSTCMKMLCGTLDPTYGDAFVNGFSITSDRVMARRNLGIAMQQDIIWDDVNVEDHLLLFGRLRGLHGRKLRAAVKKMLASLGFPDKRYSLAGTLSGGQKRRLCVGLSMVGGNRVVYLDEPTAGLDPVSRRQLWELVQKNRKGRAILLTTHFMDEADVLGDRIAIVKEGRLRALGSARFLKQRFGVGYVLRMSLKEGTQVDPIVQLVQSHIPSAAISSSAGTELALRMPKEAVEVFPTVLEHLENDAEATLGVLSFGIETTTLEEVFMRIVNEDDEKLMIDHEEANRLLTASPEERVRMQKELEERDEKRNPLSKKLLKYLLVKGTNATNSNTSAVIQGQVKVMLWKRFNQFVRSRSQWVTGWAIPFELCLLIAALLVTMPNDLIGDNHDIEYSSYYSGERTIYGGPSESTATSYMNEAFGITNAEYVGQSYAEVYSTIREVASAGSGVPSVDGIFYDNLNNFTVMYNASYPLNFAAAVQNMLNKAIQSSTDNLLTINQGFSAMPNSLLPNQMNNGFFVAILVSLIGGSFGAGLSIIVSGERVSLVKHQQLASGTSTIAYWLGNFIFDFCHMFGFVMIFAVIMAIFIPSTYGGEGFGYVFGAGFFFVLASLFRFYSFSYAIGDVRLAQSIYFYGSMASVFVLVDIWFTVLFSTADGDVSNSAVQFLCKIFTLLDPAFGWYTIILFVNNYLGILTRNEGVDFWDTSIGGAIMEMLIVDAFLYPAIFFLFVEGGWHMFFFRSQRVRDDTTNQQGNKNDYEMIKNPLNLIISHDNEEEDKGEDLSQPLAPRKVSITTLDRSVVNEDPDVYAEKVKVRRLLKSESSLDRKVNAIFMANLRKVYYARGSIPSKVAVQGVSLTIPCGEIFGLLGANGAGKTTLLKMVSGLEAPSSGMALINGYDVVQETSLAQRSMGLCPQFDTLIERLSVRENLLFFGQIKGLKDKHLVPVCEAFMQALNIKRYEHKLVQELSGGNRRKVSLAVALMGSPPTVYLDEPSTGLDPVASRLMWRLLSRIAAVKQTAIVLTTHNMMECEAVCTRVCIMKLGQMVCLGDSQHLRSTHGTGFQLELSLKEDGPGNAAAKQFVVDRFPQSVLIEEHLTMLNYEIPRESIPHLSVTFRMLQENKERLGVEDYSLSQSTLEQVFLKQIRVNESDMAKLADQENLDKRIPMLQDYAIAYFIWFIALIIPGLHHFYLGNYWRGLKYLLTLNELEAGWLLDLFDMHVLVQKSVQERGHARCCCCAAHPNKTKKPTIMTQVEVKRTSTRSSKKKDQPPAVRVDEADLLDLEEGEVSKKSRNSRKESDRVPLL
eukprot:gene2043-2228_t